MTDAQVTFLTRIALRLWALLVAAGALGSLLWSLVMTWEAGAAAGGLVLPHLIHIAIAALLWWKADPLVDAVIGAFPEGIFARRGGDGAADPDPRH